MRIAILIFFVFIFHNSFAQQSTILMGEPMNKIDYSTLIQKNKFVKEMIYVSRKGHRNDDSALFIVTYFGSKGEILEKDEFGINSLSPRRITNYEYSNNLLSRTESTEGYADSTITDYEYDSLGNKVNSKTYSYYQVGTADNFSFLEEKYEYDLNNRVSKLYAKSDTTDFMLLNTYDYEGKYLKEVKSYDVMENWKGSDLYEYDTLLQKERIYSLFGSDKKIQQEFSFNENKQLTEFIFFRYSSYDGRHKSHENFEYYDNGLTYKETVMPENGEVVYYKHYYFTK